MKYIALLLLATSALAQAETSSSSFGVSITILPPCVAGPVREAGDKGPPDKPCKSPTKKVGD